MQLAVTITVTMLKRSFALLLAVATVLVSHACKHWDEWPRNKYMQLHPGLQIRRAGLYGLNNYVGGCFDGQ